MSRSKSVWFGAAVLLPVVLVAAGPLAADQNGWEVGLKLGSSSFERSFGEQDRPKVFDDSVDASAVEVTYFFHDYLGVQAGYQNLGTFRGVGSSCPFDPKTCREILALFAPAVAEAEVTGWSLAVVPRWSFTRRLAARGKLGVFDRETELSSDVQLEGGGRDRVRLSGTDFLVGAGLHYRVAKRLGALIEYQRTDLDTAAVGLTWSF